MKKILVVGSLGNMATRYSRILDHLGYAWCGIDRGDDLPDMTTIRGIIIATPTGTHTEMLRKFMRYGVPILIEKPIAKGVIELANMFDVLEMSPAPVQMINQYRHLVHEDDKGPTHYNYFKSGTDGLAFDCINIIGLAKDEVTLDYKSPIWTCIINGRELNIADMDHAYIIEIDRWVRFPKNNLDYMKKAHRKVIEYVRQANIKKT